MLPSCARLRLKADVEDWVVRIQSMVPCCGQLALESGTFRSSCKVVLPGRLGASLHDGFVTKSTPGQAEVQFPSPASVVGAWTFIQKNILLGISKWTARRCGGTTPC